MKKLLIMAVAACCLAACNKELGPEYKVAPVISNVSCSPGLDDVHAGDDVRVTATVTSEYGFTGISILRALNDDETKVKEEGAWLSTNKTDTEKRYSGTIGKEKACIRSPRYTNIPCRKRPTRSRCPTPKRINLHTI